MYVRYPPPQQNSCFRSNVLGTKFTVYDGGENPEKKPFIQESEPVRQELAAVCYVSEMHTLYSTDIQKH